MTNRWSPTTVLVLLLIASATFADMADSAVVQLSEASCRPEVTIQLSPSPWSICLNRMDPGKDSCAKVTIDGSRLFGALLHFSRSDSGTWRYTGMSGPDSSALIPDIRIELTNLPDGTLERAAFYPDTHGDSLRLTPDVRIENDRPAEPDTLPEVNLSIRRTVFDCNPKTYKVVVEERIFTFPPGFRRDPVLNYAEISMFHSGMSVRMPTAYSLENRALLFLYWRVLQLAPLKFDDPYEILRKSAAFNRMNRKRPEVAAAKVKKPLRVKFRALR